MAPYGMYEQPCPPFYPGYPPAMGEWESSYRPPMTAEEGEKEWLRTQAEFIRQEIDRINNRISELEK
jgi:hypothetical protein